MYHCLFKKKVMIFFVHEFQNSKVQNIKMKQITLKEIVIKLIFYFIF